MKSPVNNNYARSVNFLKVYVVKSVLKLLGLWLVFSLSLLHGQSKIVIESDEFRYTATFDQSRISEGRLRELLFLSPYDFSGSDSQVGNEAVIMGFEERDHTLRKGPVAYSLELCIEREPRYRPCGTRDIVDVNFFENAKINVDRNDRVLAAITRLEVPTELASILQQFQDSMTFYSTMERRRLEYLQTSDLAILSRSVGNLDPLKICGKELGELKGSETIRRRYELSQHEWHNCLNSEWNRVSPMYPRNAWTTFIHAFGISEKYTYKPVD